LGVVGELQVDEARAQVGLHLGLAADGEVVLDQPTTHPRAVVVAIAPALEAKAERAERLDALPLAHRHPNDEHLVLPLRAEDVRAGLLLGEVDDLGVGLVATRGRSR